MTRPAVVAAIQPDLPMRYQPEAVLPALKQAVTATANRMGLLVIAAGVNEPGPSKQLALITLDECVMLVAKRLRQGDNLHGSARTLAEDYCVAHPEHTAEQIIALARAA